MSSLRNLFLIVLIYRKSIVREKWGKEGPFLYSSIIRVIQWQTGILIITHDPHKIWSSVSVPGWTGDPAVFCLLKSELTDFKWVYLSTPSLVRRGNQAQQHNFRSFSKPPDPLSEISSPFIPFTPMGLYAEPLYSANQAVSTTPTLFNRV